MGTLGGSQGLQVSREGNWRPEKSRGLINEFSLQRTLQNLINLCPVSSKILEYFPSLSCSLIHTHRNIHISPKMNSPGSNFIETCRQDCVFGFCLPGQMQNPVIRSQCCQREGYLALYCFVHKVAPIGPNLILGCPTCTEVRRPI